MNERRDLRVSAPKRTAAFDPLQTFARPYLSASMDKFKEATRELEADEGEGRWEERLKKVAKQKAAEPKS